MAVSGQSAACVTLCGTAVPAERQESPNRRTRQSDEGYSVRNTNPECPNDVPPDRGLTCRRCGWRRLRVIYTRAAIGGKVVRRRECRNCRVRVTTWERAIGLG